MINDLINRFVMPLSLQTAYLFIISIPVACISWTVTHEQIFAEPRNYCIRQSQACKKLITRKFFYLFTCEYCFSHYITLIFLYITRYHLLYAGWRGYLLGGFSIVWIANVYMAVFNLLRLGVKNEKLEADIKEKEDAIVKDEAE